MAHASVNWKEENKHEIYKKADAIENKKKRGQKARDMGLYYCEVCDKMITQGQKPSHLISDEHEKILATLTV